MSKVDVIRRFYELPRNTVDVRGELMAMLTDDIEYVGLGKESAKGREAVERLFRKYESVGQANIEFDIKHIAEAGDYVLVDMIDTITVGEKKTAVQFSNVFGVRGDKIFYWREHYDIGRYEAAFGRAVPITEIAQS